MSKRSYFDRIQKTKSGFMEDFSEPEHEGRSHPAVPFQMTQYDLDLRDSDKDPIGSKSAENIMPMALQAKMEKSFGADFSEVNIHANSAAATRVGALAYAEGEDVHFAPGQYDPQSSKGQELIGHELTHVLQQREGKVHPSGERAGFSVNVDKKLEREADEGGKAAAENKLQHNRATHSASTGSSVPMVQQFKLPGMGVDIDELLRRKDKVPDDVPGGGGLLLDDLLPKLHSNELAGDPDLELCLIGGPMFRQGSRGESVRRIQTALVRLGFPLPRFGTDGIFMHETKGAVVNFQLKHGLSPDGIVGKFTLGKLDSSLSNRKSKPNVLPNKLLDLLDEIIRRLGKNPNIPGGGKIDPSFVEELKKLLKQQEDPSKPGNEKIDPQLLEDLKKLLKLEDDPVPKPEDDKIDPKKLELLF